MQTVDRITNIIVWLCRLGLGLSFAILVGTVLIQVIGRTVGSSPVWTEELTRYALLYLAAFGAGLALRSGDLVNVDVVCEVLPGRAPWWLRLFAAGVTAALALYLLPSGWKYVSIGRMQTSPALGLQMSWAHFSVFLLLALLVVFATLRIVGMLARVDDGLPQKSDED